LQSPLLDANSCFLTKAFYFSRDKNEYFCWLQMYLLVDYVQGVIFKWVPLPGLFNWVSSDLSSDLYSFYFLLYNNVYSFRLKE
jgi:hypothetical protein